MELRREGTYDSALSGPSDVRFQANRTAARASPRRDEDRWRFHRPSPGAHWPLRRAHRTSASQMPARDKTAITTAEDSYR